MRRLPSLKAYVISFSLLCFASLSYMWMAETQVHDVPDWFDREDVELVVVASGTSNASIRRPITYTWHLRKKARGHRSVVAAKVPRLRRRNRSVAVGGARAGRGAMRTSSAPRRVSKSRRKPILWVHIHKAAGTFMCSLARRNREKIVKPHKNCNWNKHDSYQDSGHLELRPSCLRRLRYFRENRLTYGQIEREFTPSDFCPHAFSYGIMLREPISLMLSQIHYAKTYNSHLNKSTFLHEIKRKLDERPVSRGGLNQFPLWKTMDNYQIRLIADALDVPVGHINETHKKAAAKVLSSFTVVARVDDLQDPTRRMALVSKLGWRNPGLSMKRLNRAKNKSEKFSVNELLFLRDLNRYEIELYQEIGDCGAMYCNRSNVTE